MNRTQRLLRKNDFKLVRQGTRHQMWERDGVVVPISRGRSDWSLRKLESAVINKSKMRKAA